MASKTAQLQIRVSPTEKAALKRLAAAEGLSVSEFVLRQALPVATTPLLSWVASVQAGRSVANSVSDLTLQLRHLDDGAFLAATRTLDPADLPELLANCAAAAVEHEASRRGLTAPTWTEAVPAMRTPWFALRLPSLRPNQMRVAPVEYKRRGVYLQREGDPSR